MASAALAVVVLLALSIWWLPKWLSSSSSNQQLDSDRQPNVADALAKGQKLLAEGQFRLAYQTLHSQGDAQSLPLSAQQRRTWRQTLRQASLLADLAPESLEEILRHAAGMRPEEWQADFDNRYLGRAVVWDDEFGRLAQGGWVCKTYEVKQGADAVQLAFNDVKLLQRLEPFAGQRFVIGVRYASIKLEPPGPRWVVRFDPDSGVLLTDPGAAATQSAALAGPEGEQHLRRQAEWLEEIDQ